MSLDIDGYGFSEDERTTGRLIGDVRVLSPSGIERIADGWDRYVGETGAQTFVAVERAALHAIEKAGRGSVWDEIRRSMFGLTESGDALVSWKAEHGQVGHKAERAAFAAALGLLACDLISRDETKTLLRPMAESLPWLLPDTAA